MKTRWQMKTFRASHHEGRGAPIRQLATSLAVGCAMLVSFGGAADAGTDACKAITKLAFSSCEAEARGTKLLTEARCTNLADQAAQKTCAQQAASDAQDEVQSCKEQRGLRRGVCMRLGPAPYSPVISPANFPTSTTIDNPFFPLVPGKTFVYEGQTSEGFEHVEFAVTHATRVILGITCVEVHDVRQLDGTTVEDTRDWFAQDQAGNVWYFGENTTLVENGLPTDLSGSWTAGVDGAQPGFVMEAHPAIGDFYRQEFLVGEAEDLAEVKSLTASEAVPYTSCTNECLETEESSPLAPGDIEHKFYKMGIGNILTIDFAVDPPERSELVNILTVP